MEIIGYVEQAPNFGERMSELNSLDRQNIRKVIRRLDTFRFELKKIAGHGLQGAGHPSIRMDLAENITRHKRLLLEAGVYICPVKQEAREYKSRREMKGHF